MRPVSAPRRHLVPTYPPWRCGPAGGHPASRLLCGLPMRGGAVGCSLGVSRRFIGLQKGRGKVTGNANSTRHPDPPSCQLLSRQPTRPGEGGRSPGRIRLGPGKCGAVNANKPPRVSAVPGSLTPADEPAASAFRGQVRSASVTNGDCVKLPLAAVVTSDHQG